MDKKFVVLVVEDEIVRQALAKNLLSPHAEVLSAICLRDAMLCIDERDNIDIVILDWYVPMFRDEPLRLRDTTECLIYPLIEKFSSIRMYSASSEEENNQQLEKMGCIRATKESAPQMVLKYMLKE